MVGRFLYRCYIAGVVAIIVVFMTFFLFMTTIDIVTALARARVHYLVQ